MPVDTIQETEILQALRCFYLESQSNKTGKKSLASIFQEGSSFMTNGYYYSGNKELKRLAKHIYNKLTENRAKTPNKNLQFIAKTPFKNNNIKLQIPHKITKLYDILLKKELETKRFTKEVAPKNNEAENKPKMSLIPVDLLGKYLCPAYEVGLIKYYRDSWRKGFQYSVMIDAARRHLSCFWDQGEDYDIEAMTNFKIKMHHLGSVIFCCLCILNDIDQKGGDNDDRRLVKEQNGGTTPI